MGGLRHNTIVLNWPEKWNKDYFNNYEASIDEDESCMSLASFVRKWMPSYYRIHR
jgi:hypothetical protein